MARLLQALRKVTGNQKTTFNNKGMQKNTSENKIVNSSRWYHSSQQRSGNGLKFAWAHQNCTTEGLESISWSHESRFLLVCRIGTWQTTWKYGSIVPSISGLCLWWCNSVEVYFLWAFRTNCASLVPYTLPEYYLSCPWCTCPLMSQRTEQTGFLNMNLNKFTLLKFPQQSSQLNAWEHLW